MNRILYFWFPLLFAVSVFAQLSPGDLHKSHAHLEGVMNCTQCHEIGQQLSGDYCLNCHVLLKERISEGKGLHAGKDYRKCENCHIEHQGRDYDLIYWKDGKDKFDHSLTGYPLEGKHATLSCEKCHRESYIQTPEKYKSKGKDLKQTFLGLNRDCVSCHHDEHRGQIGESCVKCHGMESWKPATQFDHNKTKFKLTGLHAQTACDKCHVTITDNKYPDDPDFLKFAPLTFNTCTDCHADIHRNKFGQNCTQCHNTAGWKSTELTGFDHGKTAYPLLGKHANVQCSQCHPPGRSVRISRFQNCTDCHSDYHNGNFAGRVMKGACEECHTVNGFSPSKFTIEQHRLTDYPLTGSHLAVPCVACHEKIVLSNGKGNVRFTYQSDRCVECHKDPHKGEVDNYLGKKSSLTNMDGCEHCHSVDSWTRVSFDHQATKFPLEGRHLSAKCGDCHRPIRKGTELERLQFLGMTPLCRDCHTDIHLGQFQEAGAPDGIRCERCHTSKDWLAEKFDHNRDSVFKLDGAHQRVRCEQCHKNAVKNETTFTVYKPMSTECKSCHANIISNN